MYKLLGVPCAIFLLLLVPLLTINPRIPVPSLKAAETDRLLTTKSRDGFKIVEDHVKEDVDALSGSAKVRRRSPCSTRQQRLTIGERNNELHSQDVASLTTTAPGQPSSGIPPQEALAIGEDQTKPDMHNVVKQQVGQDAILATLADFRQRLQDDLAGIRETQQRSERELRVLRQQVARMMTRQPTNNESTSEGTSHPGQRLVRAEGRRDLNQSASNRSMERYLLHMQHGTRVEGCPLCASRHTVTDEIPRFC